MEDNWCTIHLQSLGPLRAQAHKGIEKEERGRLFPCRPSKSLASRMLSGDQLLIGRQQQVVRDKDEG